MRRELKIETEVLKENYQLYLGDCLEVMKIIPDKSVDMILTDLPYGTTRCAWDVIIPFDKLWNHYNRIVKDEGIIVLFGSQPFTTKLIFSNIENFRYEIIWQKNNCSNFQLANVQPLKYHENICIFYNDIIQDCFSKIIKENMKKLNLKQSDLSKLCLSKNGKPTGWLSNKLKGTQIPTREQWDKLCKVFGISNEYDKILCNIKNHTYNKSVNRCNKVCNNKGKAGKLGHLSTKEDIYVQEYENYPHSIVTFDREINTVHPTQKPVSLLEYLIKTYTNENEIILDSCMGSGSTGVAALNLNRKFIGIELNEEYFEISKKRIEEI